MASIFDKANTRLPGLLRPFSRIKTRLAGKKPVTATKHFALWVVKLVTVLRHKIGQRADRFVSETKMPHTAMRTQLGMIVDTRLHQRRIESSDKDSIEKQFETMGLKHGTTATKKEAEKIMTNLTVLQGALGKFVNKVDEHLQNQEAVFGQLQSEFQNGVDQLEQKAWAEFEEFLKGKNAAEITDYQSVHQLVMGTSHVQVGDEPRLPGLKYYITQIKANVAGFEKSEGETDFEAGLRMMKDKWSGHRAKIEDKLIEWKKSKDRTNARRYQHYFAALETIDRLEDMIDRPNSDTARDARQKFLGTYGEMFGVEGRKSVTKKHFDKLSEIAAQRSDDETFEDAPEYSEFSKKDQ